MIIVDGFLFHVATIVFQYGHDPKTHAKYLLGPMERVQVPGFSIQETILGAMYLYGMYNANV